MSDDDLTKKLTEKFDCCPVCDSDDVSASDYDGDRTLSCKIECADCGATWYEHYVFKSASDLRTNP